MLHTCPDYEGLNTRGEKGGKFGSTVSPLPPLLCVLCPIPAATAVPGTASYDACEISSARPPCIVVGGEDNGELVVFVMLRDICAP